jgi:hypothetical protein
LTGGTARVTQAGRKLTIRIDPPAARPPANGAAMLLPRGPSRPTQPQIDCIVKLELNGSAMDLDPL